jgi:hypothetical protein
MLNQNKQYEVETTISKSTVVNKLPMYSMESSTNNLENVQNRNEYRMIANSTTSNSYNHHLFTESSIHRPLEDEAAAIWFPSTTESRFYNFYINNKTLLEKLVGDVLVAGTISFAIAPILGVIDKAVVERVSSSKSSAIGGGGGGVEVVQKTLLQSVQNSIISIIRNPISYIRSPAFTWMWLTYAATYTTANTLRTITSHKNYNDAVSQQQQQQQQHLPHPMLSLRR